MRDTLPLDNFKIYLHLALLYITILHNIFPQIYKGWIDFFLHIEIFQL